MIGLFTSSSPDLHSSGGGGVMGGRTGGVSGLPSLHLSSGHRVVILSSSGGHGHGVVVRVVGHFVVGGVGHFVIVVVGHFVVGGVGHFVVVVGGHGQSVVVGHGHSEVRRSICI